MSASAAVSRSPDPGIGSLFWNSAGLFVGIVGSTSSVLFLRVGKLTS